MVCVWCGGLINRRLNCYQIFIKRGMTIKWVGSYFEIVISANKLRRKTAIGEFVLMFKVKFLIIRRTRVIRNELIAHGVSHIYMTMMTGATLPSLFKDGILSFL